MPERTREERALELLGQIREQAEAFEADAAAMFGGDSPQRIWAWGLRDAIDEALRVSVHLGTDLRIDPGRRGLPASGIGVRARIVPGGRWENADIVELDRPSLLVWLRSRGGANPWAEDVVLMLLAHDTRGS